MSQLLFKSGSFSVFNPQKTIMKKLKLSLILILPLLFVFSCTEKTKNVKETFLSLKSSLSNAKASPSIICFIASYTRGGIHFFNSDLPNNKATFGTLVPEAFLADKLFYVY